MMGFVFIVGEVRGWSIFEKGGFLVGNVLCVCFGGGVDGDVYDV